MSKLYNKQEISRISDKIFLGDSYDATTQYILDQNNITAILNVAGELDNKSYGRVYKHCGLIDGLGNDKEQFIEAIDTLKELLDAGHTVLIHCRMGISRSSSVLATHIARHDGRSFDKVVDYLVKIRPIVEPHFALRKMAREILKETI